MNAARSPRRPEKRNLTELVGVRLTSDELTAARILAAGTGVKVPTFLRNQLLSAIFSAGKCTRWRTDAEVVAEFLAKQVVA